MEPATVEFHAGKFVKLPGARFPGGLVKDIKIPVNNRGELLINYPGRWQDAFDLLDPAWLLEADTNPQSRRYAAQMSRNLLVVIGEAITTGKDFAVGIFEPVYPGVGIVAAVINSIITGRFITTCNLPGQILLWLALAVAVCFLVGFTRPARFLAGMAGISLLFTLVCILVFLTAGTLQPFLFPQLWLLLCMCCPGVYKQFRAEKRLALGIMDKMAALKGLLPAPGQEAFAPAVTISAPAGASFIQSIEEKFAACCKQYGITKREQKIIRLTHDGFESKEIAYKLDISPRTVSNHLANIYQKTGIRNKIEISKFFYL